jgi:hypothetical protein
MPLFGEGVLGLGSVWSLLLQILTPKPCSHFLLYENNINLRRASDVHIYCIVWFGHQTAIKDTYNTYFATFMAYMIRSNQIIIISNVSSSTA